MDILIRKAAFWAVFHWGMSFFILMSVDARMTIMSSTANRVIKNTGYLYAKMGITMFVSLYTTRLILNSLGASDFGIFNIVGGAIAMLGFLNAAMASATQRFMSYSEGEGNKEKQKSIFNVSIVLHLLISFVVGLALLIAGYFFFNGILNIPPDRVGAARVVYGSLIVSTMFTVMTVPYDAVMNAHENMKYYAIVGIIESFLKLLVAFACVYTTSDKLIVYGVLMACIPLITLTIMRVYCHKHYSECRIAVRTYWDKGLMKEMTGFAGWNFLTTVSALLSHQGVNLVLNHFFGTIVNAAQGITYQLSGQLGTLSTQITKVLNPIIVKEAGAKQLDAMYRVASLGSKITFFITSIIFLPFLLNREVLLKLWLVDVPAYTSTFIFLYFIVNLIDSIGMFFSTAINGVGNIKLISSYQSVVSFLPFVGIVFLFDMGFPAYWLYILMIGASVIKLWLRIYYSYKLCAFDLMGMLIYDVLAPLSCVTITYLFCWWIKVNFINSNQMKYVILNVIFPMILYSGSFLIFVLTKKEKTIICSKIKYRELI